MVLFGVIFRDALIRRSPIIGRPIIGA